MNDQESLIQFPCDFPIKIVGANSDEFIQEIKNIALRHFPDLTDDAMKHKVSAQNNYLAITLTVHALNKEMLDAFYREVSSNPQVKMVL